MDEVVAEAPWVIDEAFIKKYEIDYVAHDEDPYASGDHADVYGYAKDQGAFTCLSTFHSTYSYIVQVNSYPRAARQESRRRNY